MLPEELEEWLTSLGYPKYRARQVFGWINKQGAGSVRQMTNLPATLRELLQKDFRTGTVEAEQCSKDGSRKLLIRFDDGQRVETVLLPQGTRFTICLSSQAGCGMGCAFCATGREGLSRQLSAGEITEQVRLAELKFDKPASNVVFMGMGEPLANYENTVRAIKLLNHPWGRNIGIRHLTISTCGLVPQIQKLSELDWQIVLAVSLHAATDQLRGKLMPINSKYPLSKLLPACREYAARTGRRVTFEYVMLKGVNDGEEQLRALSKLLRGWLCHLNLIPFNPAAGLPYTACSAREIRQFALRLEAQGIAVTVRSSMGADVAAACGQLRGGRVGHEHPGKN